MTFVNKRKKLMTWYDRQTWQERERTKEGEKEIVKDRDRHI